MMFGAFGRLISVPATAGAARLRRTPDIAASPAPICSKLRRVVERGDAPASPVFPSSAPMLLSSLPAAPSIRVHLDMGNPSDTGAVRCDATGRSRTDGPDY